MSVYNIISRISSVENSVDELSSKADSTNAVLSGTTTIYGSAVLNGPVVFNSTIAGIDLADVNGLQSALDLKAPKESPTFTGTVNGITKSMVGLGNVDNTTDASKPISSLTQTALDAKG